MFEVHYTANELKDLSIFCVVWTAKFGLSWSSQAVIQPIARYLVEAGFFVGVVHAKLIHDFGNNSIRKVKTDRADAIKIANYGLSNWISLSGTHQRTKPDCY